MREKLPGRYGKSMSGEKSIMTDGFYKGRKVFITGHTGFKGSWLAIWLKKLGAEVSGFALEPPTEPSMFEICGIGEKSIPSQETYGTGMVWKMRSLKPSRK